MASPSFELASSSPEASPAIVSQRSSGTQEEEIIELSFGSLSYYSGDQGPGTPATVSLVLSEAGKSPSASVGGQDDFLGLEKGSPISEAEWNKLVAWGNPKKPVGAVETSSPLPTAVTGLGFDNFGSFAAGFGKGSVSPSPGYLPWAFKEVALAGKLTASLKRKREEAGEDQQQPRCPVFCLCRYKLS